MKVMLQTDRLSVGARLRPTTLTIREGEFVGLIGPNGAGKTTLLRAALGLAKATGASSLLSYPVQERPQHVAYLPQGRDVVWPVPVRELVALGYRANPRHRGKGVPEVAALLKRWNLTENAETPVTSLSGGEQARVLLARALAQDAPLLLADEPCASLDPAQALAVARSLRAEADRGRAVLASLHDIPLAARRCTRVLVMADGAIVADGPPDTVLTAELMAKVFAVGFSRHDNAAGPAWVVSELAGQ